MINYTKEALDEMVNNFKACPLYDSVNESTRTRIGTVISISRTETGIEFISRVNQ